MSAKRKLWWMKAALWSWGLGVWAWWVWRVASGGAGANPAEWLQARSGWQAAAWLGASLMASPIARFAPGMGWIIGARRLAGLWACAMATAHAAMWLGLEHGFDGEQAWKEMGKPAYLLGLAALMVLWALAASSGARAKRALGRGWGKLHAGVYAVACAALLHWYWIREPKGRLDEWKWWLAALIGWGCVRMGMAWDRRRKRLNVSKD